MTYLIIVFLFFNCRPIYSQVVVSDEDFKFWHKGPDLSLFPPLPIAIPWSDEEQCRKDSQIVVDNLRNHTFWAVQMYESSVRETMGVLFGNMYQIGQFDECMRVKQPIQVKMCIIEYDADTSAVSFNPSDPYAIDPPFNESAFKKLQPHNNLLHQTDFYTALYLYRLCAIGIVLLSLTSTLIDYIQVEREKESRGRKLLMAFSLLRNWKKFISHEQEPSPLDFLYGFRAISICILLFDHRAAIFVGANVFNYQKIEEELRGYNRVFLPSGDLGLGTFFYIAGLLSLYLIMEVREKRYINPLIVIIARYVRLIPLYMFVVWFHASALLRTGSGIGWKYTMTNESLFCAENWWTNALFINNYVNPERMCMLHSWYLSCDYQLFIICVLVTYTILKSKKVGLSILAALLIVSIITPGILTVVYDLPPIVLYYAEFVKQPREYPTYIWHYIKTHNRGESYFIGMLSGYVLYRTKEAKKLLGTTVSILLNLFGLFLLFLPMLIGARYYDIQYEYGPIEAGIFCVARRLVWTIGITIIMFTYRFGHIPIMGSICTSMVGIILSKLSLGMYLIHFIYQMADHANDLTSRPFSNVDMAIQGTSDTVQILLYAIVLYHLIELPSREIFKELVFSRVEKKKPADESIKGAFEENTIQNNLELVPTETVKL